MIALTAAGFSVSKVKTRPGATVTLDLAPGAAVYACDRTGRPLPWTPGDATGPLPRLLAGLRVLNEPRDIDPVRLASFPGVDCVYARLDWADVEREPGVYDWSSLDRIADAAMAAGRYFAAGLRAGVSGTPRHVLATVPTVRLRGIAVPIALVHTDEYRAVYAAVEAALAAHLKADARRYLRCASVTVSGCNWHTLEVRYPNREAGEDGADVADAVRLAEAGHTAAGLRAFFEDRFERLPELLPGKDLTLPILQGGFPVASGRSSTDQLDTVLTDGLAALGGRLVVQHLGLSPDRAPNPWALRAGRSGSPTAFQTTNDLGPGRVRDAIDTLLTRTAGRWLELYPRDVPPEGLRAEADRIAARGGPRPTRHSWQAPRGLSYVADARDPSRVLTVGAE